jgi:hypothetical protein
MSAGALHTVDSGSSGTAQGGMRVAGAGVDTSHGPILYLEGITVAFDGFKALVQDVFELWRDLSSQHPIPAAQSARRFIEVFTDEVGLTPKLFCRVQRFQETVRRIGMGRRVDWAGMALDCGYFDQAHFIHDFRAFSGLSPSAYAAQRTGHLNHVPILD